MKKRVGIVGAAIFMAALIGCYAAPVVADKSYPQAAKLGVTAESYGTDIFVFKDNENGYICYVSDGYESGGISCLPMKETYNGQR